MRRRGRGAGRDGRDHAAEKQAWRGLIARRGRGAAGGQGDPTGSSRGGRPGSGQEAARRFVEAMGGNGCTAISIPLDEVSGGAQADRIALTIALPARAKLNLDLEVLG